MDLEFSFKRSGWGGGGSQDSRVPPKQRINFLILQFENYSRTLFLNTKYFLIFKFFNIFLCWNF